VAAVAVVGIAGGLFVGKKLYDRHKAGAGRKPGASGSFASREVVDDGPESPYLAQFKVAHPKTFRETVPVPDAVVVGLSYDAETGANVNLLASAFDAYGNNLGYIQAGGQLTNLFNSAIQHTGDSQAESLGDHENIVFDLRAVPPQCSTILFGAYLVNPPTHGVPKAYIHMLPMLRAEQIAQQETSGGTREIDYDSDEEEKFESGSRGIGPEDDNDDDESLVRLYMDELDSTTFGSQRGFVGGKLFRDPSSGAWFFTPFRTPVPADPNLGVWPAFEHYARPAPAY